MTERHLCASPQMNAGHISFAPKLCLALAACLATGPTMAKSLLNPAGLEARFAPPTEASSLDFPRVFDAQDEETPVHVDPDVQPTQLSLGIGAALASPLRLGLQSQVRGPSRPARRAAAAGGIASIPFMIGDTGAGTCVSFNTTGYLETDLSHPTLTCSRLNISENNTPLTTDRVYFSYRHFENATPVRFYDLKEILNVDRYTIGVEKTFLDGLFSIELRTPIDRRLSSNTQSIAADTDGDFLELPDLVQITSGRDTELANMSTIFKMMLVETPRFAMSGGLGVTAPTAKDVTYQADVENVFIFFNTFDPPFAVFALYDIDVHVENETVYLSPFLSWTYRPNRRFFHQGFFQIEAAANPSTVTIRDGSSTGLVYSDLAAFDPLDPDFGVGWTINDGFPGEATVPLHAQTLMRLNLGVGCFLVDEPRNKYLKQLAAIFELHYTTPLQPAKLSAVPLEFVVVSGTETITNDAFDPVIGNLNSRVDILNAVAGVSATVGKTVITHGFTAPITDQDNRGFDFEYNLQIQRLF